MCDSVLWKSGVYVCVFVRMCVEEGQGGAERCQTTKRQSERKMVFAKDEWVRKSEVIEKCRVRQRRHEGGRRWLRVVNDFARRSQTAFTWLGGVFVLTHHCVKHWRISHAFVNETKKIFCIDCSRVIWMRQEKREGLTRTVKLSTDARQHND